MRVPVSELCLFVGLLLADIGSAWSQAPAQNNVLQNPSGSQHSQPVAGTASKPPSAAPRIAVQKTGGAKSDKPPVVPPHGQIHPQKPVTAGGKAAGPLPAAVAGGSPPAEAAVPAPAPEAAKLADPEKPEGAPAKLPRFASLRSDDVNMRAGPGTRYRIDWVYRRRDLPVEIEREFDVWRWVRDADGIQGWVHQATLMGRRSFIVTKAEATLRVEASDTASAVAVLKSGVIGRIRSCPGTSDWCNVQTGSYRGYLRRSQLWGLLPGEILNP